MFVFFLGFLFVIVIPLAEGFLLALLLREIHIRYPLPLGGEIETPVRRKIRANLQAQKELAAEVYEKSGKVDISPPPEPIVEVPSAAVPIPQEEPAVALAEVSVFDEGHIPKGLPVNEVLDSMITKSPSDIPNDFESRIEAAARSDSDVSSGFQTPFDEMDLDDLNALAAALPRGKIDFSQELETESAVPQPISETAKEILGNNFDFGTLEAKPKNQLPEETAESESAAVMDVQDNGSGTIQVSSMFLPNVSPLLENYTAAQTIFPDFSDDWNQKTAIADVAIEGDIEQFCFTAESTPMFVRKKKSS